MNNTTHFTPPEGIAAMSHNNTIEIFHYSAALLATLKAELEGTDNSKEVIKEIGDVLINEMIEVLAQNDAATGPFMKKAGATDTEVEKFHEQLDQLYEAFYSSMLTRK